MQFKQEFVNIFLIDILIYKNMPIIKSAIKKVRQDKKRTIRNSRQKKVLKEAIKKYKETKIIKDYPKLVSLIDKAVKRNLIHKNKAARLKSQFSKIGKKG